MFLLSKITQLTIFSICCLVGQSALATGEDIKGNTTCSILKDNKLIKQAPCSYTGLVYGSIRYNENSYNFTVKGYGKISISSSVSAKLDKKGEMIEGKDGVEYEDGVVTLNNKPATSFYRDMKTLKIIPASSYAKNFEKLQKTALSCTQQLKTKLEVCMPAKDEAES